MDISSLLNTLNEPQRQAVSAAPGNILVLAGAGSGKTRVLVHRIAWLMQVEGVPPSSILAVTFTNKAAREMRSRIDELVHIPNRGLWVGTFHGIAHRLLKTHWQAAGLEQNFQILDSEDQLRLIKRINKQLDLDEERWPARQAQSFINTHKDEGRRSAHLQEHGDTYHLTLRRVYLAYEEACHRGNLVDFAELLLRAHELWLQQPTILQHYQQRFSHILVDEFQDTNTIQYAWIRVLAADKLNVIAVGDDDQSIYGWRGAKIENIQLFNQDFKNVQTILLEQNYRSTQTILKAANAVIDNNQGRLGKALWSEGDEGEPLALYAGFNEYDEARFVIEHIEHDIRQGFSRCEIAILYRSNAQSRVLEEALLRSAIPYRIYGGLRFYDRLEIKNVLAYLRLIINRNDDTALERVINTPTRGIGGKTVELLRSNATEQQISLWHSAVDIIERKLVSARATNALLAFIELIDRLHNETNTLPLHEQCDHVIEASGLLAFHKKEKGEKGLARQENLNELVSACQQFDPQTDDDSPPLRQFIDQASLESGDVQGGEDEDCVQLMTLHSAKGLEFPVVFLVGMEENLFPHQMSLDEPGRLEEERRLCYVGITRAKQKLYFSYAETRRLHGKERYNSRSRFIKEVPSQLIHELRSHTRISRPAKVATTDYSAFNHSAFKQQEAEEYSLSLGQRVLHGIFGEGIILGVEGQGSSARVQVNFDTEGSKWLVLQYAKLEAL